MCMRVLKEYVAIYNIMIMCVTCFAVGMDMNIQCKIISICNKYVSMCVLV